MKREKMDKIFRRSYDVQICYIYDKLDELVEGYNEINRGIGVIKHTLIDMEFYEVTKKLDKMDKRICDIGKVISK